MAAWLAPILALVPAALNPSVSTPEGRVAPHLPRQCLAYLFAHGPEPQNWLCGVVHPGVVAPVILGTLRISA